MRIAAMWQSIGLFDGLGSSRAMICGKVVDREGSDDPAGRAVRVCSWTDGAEQLNEG